MRHIVVVGGIVTNAVMADEVTGRANGWIPSEEVGIGWVHDGEKFIDKTDQAVVRAEQMRMQRDDLLAAADLVVLPDRWAAMSPEQQTAWAAYRQALRDIPTQEGFPFDIEWPQKPE